MIWGRRVAGWFARAVLALGLALGLAGAARAAWLRVETDKFVVYGQGSEASLRDYATKLTIYDGILRRYNPVTQGRRPATKVQVFMVRSHEDLRRVSPGIGNDYAGFYTAGGDGQIAVVQTNVTESRDLILFHEYAHHFMLENFPAAYPAWFVEGWAEYFSTTQIHPKSIDVGGFSPGRALTILEAEWLPLDVLLTRTTWQTRGEATQAYYAEAWLLTHYMMSDATRAAQLDKATVAISQGTPPVQAFEAATGQSLADITAALKKYRRLPVMSFPIEAMTPPQMVVSAMPASAEDLLLDSARLMMSAPGRVDEAFLARVRRTAARYPNDPLAERTLARAEFLMGEVAAGEAIMARRLASAAAEPEDELLAGEGEVFAGMRDPAQRQERYRAARPHLMKAYQRNPGDFRCLHAYAISRSVEPNYPSENDMNALIEARNLAPSVMDNSLQLGLALAHKGQMADARRVLAPLVNNPHGGAIARAASQVLAGQPVTTEDDETTQPPAKPAS